MPESENGYSVLAPEQVQRWTLPLRDGLTKTLLLRPGHTGFVLAHFALFFDEEVESLSRQKQLDDWGYAYRQIANSNVWSNHASGTAIDLNATEHPQGSRGTFASRQVGTFRKRLRLMRGVIRWGGDFHTLVDEMHWEINKSPRYVRILAAVLRQTPRGKRLLVANHHYKRWMQSR